MQLEDCTKEELIFIINSFGLDFDSSLQVTVLSRRSRNLGKQATAALRWSIELAKLGEVGASLQAYEKYRKLSNREDKIMKEMEKLII